MNNVLVANAGTRPENRAWNAAILALAALLMLAATAAFVGLGSWNFGSSGAGGPAGEAALPPGKTQPDASQATAFLAAPGEAKTEAQAKTRARVNRNLQQGPLAEDYLNEYAAEALPALREALQESDGKVRLNAVRSLERMGRNAREAIPDLYAMLRDGGNGNGALRKAAARALKRIGEDAKLKGNGEKEDGDGKADDKDKDDDGKADDKDKDDDGKADDDDDDDGKAGKDDGDEDDEADDGDDDGDGKAGKDDDGDDNEADDDDEDGGSGKAKGGSGAAPEQW